VGEVVQGTDRQVNEEGEAVALPLWAPVEVVAPVVVLDELVSHRFEPGWRNTLENLGVLHCTTVTVFRALHKYCTTLHCMNFTAQHYTTLHSLNQTGETFLRI
jgi:hypothetical protein